MIRGKSKRNEVLSKEEWWDEVVFKGDQKGIKKIYVCGLF